ncbi:LysR family transcriptional regulator [Eremococcus coleocola]|uniref:Transcriptional regulator, LysR family n=1 Tax=Eremococcus coleocola ACS-139-V-Col8 TaxID=908337 RepID=E4KMN1_9LACT|nr:LysR family transcriptional regulator [Eremococcus coleocola]EFR31753.1 transcriptional regulator, LysR family [Eremococcus coleocola ACS-139-V-Col8]
MNIQHIKYFIAVAEHRNISKAAQGLYLSQPSLSLTIKNLEAELGSPLIYYKNRKMYLTDFGEYVFTEGKKILENYDTFVEKINNFHQQVPQKIAIGSTNLFVLQHQEKIVKFIDSTPEAEIHSIQTGSIHLQDMLVQEEIDLGLISDPIVLPNIVIEPLNIGYDVSVVISADNPLAAQAKLQFKDLEALNFCVLSEDYVLSNRYLIERGKENHFEPHISFIHNDWEILVHYTKQLKAVCLLPSALESNCVVDGLKWIPLDDPINYFPVNVAYLKDKKLSKLALKLINCLKED